MLYPCAQHTGLHLTLLHKWVCKHVTSLVRLLYQHYEQMLFSTCFGVCFAIMEQNLHLCPLCWQCVSISPPLWSFVWVCEWMVPELDCFAVFVCYQGKQRRAVHLAQIRDLFNTYWHHGGNNPSAKSWFNFEKCLARLRWECMFYKMKSTQWSYTEPNKTCMVSFSCKLPPLLATPAQFRYQGLMKLKVTSRKQGRVLSPCWTLCTRPPMWSDASSTVTSVKPFSSRILVAARPAKPAPITTIRGCRWVRSPLLRGSSVLSDEISQLCMPSKLLFDGVWGQKRDRRRKL